MQIWKPSVQNWRSGVRFSCVRVRFWDSGVRFFQPGVAFWLVGVRFRSSGVGFWTFHEAFWEVSVENRVQRVRFPKINPSISSVDLREVKRTLAFGAAVVSVFSKMTLSDLPQVQALSAREKLQLVDELWVDVAHDLDALEISAEEKLLLDERWSRFVADPSSALTLEEFQARLDLLRA